jgi:hypothetical protein
MTVAKTHLREDIKILKQQIIVIRNNLESVIIPSSCQTTGEAPLSVQRFTQRYINLLKAYRDKSDASIAGEQTLLQLAKLVENEQRELITFIISAIEILEQTINSNDSNIRMATDELYEIRSKLVQFFQTITNISGAWYKAKAKTKMMFQKGNEKDAHNRTGSVSKTSETNGPQLLQSSSGRKRKLSSKLSDSVGDESSPLHGKKTCSRSIGGTKSVQKKKIKLKKKNSSISDILDKAVSEEVPKESDKVTVTIVDPNPDRIVNPLLEVPQGSMTGEANLLVSEFVRLLPIFFPEPDTFPLSYYAKLLGFSLREDVSLEEQNGKWLLEDENGKSDPWFNIPPLGKFGIVFRDTAFNPTLDYVDKRGVRCDQYLDYVDPVWLELLNDVTSYQESSTRAATELKESRIISKDCVSLAKSLGLVSGGVTFRVGGVEDAFALSNFNEVRSLKGCILNVFTSYLTFSFANTYFFCSR